MVSIDQLILQVLDIFSILTNLIRTAVSTFVEESTMTAYLLLAILGGYYIKQKIKDSDAMLWLLSAITIFLLINYV